MWINKSVRAMVNFKEPEALKRCTIIELPVVEYPAVLLLCLRLSTPEAKLTSHIVHCFVWKCLSNVLRAVDRAVDAPRGPSDQCSAHPSYQ